MIKIFVIKNIINEGIRKDSKLIKLLNIISVIEEKIIKYLLIFSFFIIEFSPSFM